MINYIESPVILVEHSLAEKEVCGLAPFLFHIWDPAHGILCAGAKIDGVVQAAVAHKLPPECLCAVCKEKWAEIAHSSTPQK